MSTYPSFRLAQVITWATILLIIPIVLIGQYANWVRLNKPIQRQSSSQAANAWHGFSWDISEEPRPTEIEQDAPQLPWLGKILFFALDCVSSLLILVVIWYFLKLLQLYRYNSIFSPEALTMFKKMNFVALMWALYALLFDIFASTLISFFKPVGQKYIYFSLDSNDISKFFIVLILFFVSHLIQRACLIKKEHDLVV